VGRLRHFITVSAIALACVAATVAPRAADLAPTNHPPLPDTPAAYWLVPPTTAKPSPAFAGFARGVKLFNDGQYIAALPLVSDRALASTPLGDYARYYTGAIELRLERYGAAETTFKALDDRKPTGYLAEALALRQTELEIARRNPTAALSVLDRLMRQKTTALEDVLMRTARAAELAGDVDRAVATYRRLYFEFPLTAEGELAAQELSRLEPAGSTQPGRFQLELGRAERLFNARRYQAARGAFETLNRSAAREDKELIALRIAECDYYLRRYAASREALRPYLMRSAREAEARFFHLMATAALGDKETYVTLARGLTSDFPKDSWTEETLNNLASHYITVDEDEEADAIFRQMLERFPQGRYGERAAWKVGWWAYRADKFADTIRFFEDAAVLYPRADTRPAWLYWSGRAHEQLGNKAEAAARYQLTVTDYRNSYYGRLATARLDGRGVPDAARETDDAPEPSDAPRQPPNEAAIRQLLALELYDDAGREVRYAQVVWGDSPALQATLAWIRHQQAREQTARERYDSLRGGLTLMKRAYPQYLTSGAARIPPEILGVIFPIDYWPLIKKHAEEHGLDPFLMAALVNQESTFTADVQSPVNATGLMQLMAPTARRYAKKLHMPYTARTLTTPEANIRLGMAYFKDLVDRFGGVHFALASYNAGENRIPRWQAERPGLSQEEFIDDIPFPETQNYVKKILSMREDYERLYGSGLLNPDEGLSLAVTGKTGRATGAGKAGGATVAAPAKKPVAPRRKRR
jgi:soluble lytic murein transglycosylase